MPNQILKLSYHPVKISSIEAHSLTARPTRSFQSPSHLLSTRGGVAGWADQLLLRAPFLTRPPERAETRSSPKRAPSERARSASKEAGRPSRPPASHDHLSNSYLFHTPRLARRSSPQLRASTEHILIVRGLRARKLAARLAFFTATPTRHTPSQSNTAPPHRHTEGPDRAACTRRPLNR